MGICYFNFSSLISLVDTRRQELLLKTLVYNLIFLLVWNDFTYSMGTVDLLGEKLLIWFYVIKKFFLLDNFLKLQVCFNFPPLDGALLHQAKPT